MSWRFILPVAAGVLILGFVLIYKTDSGLPTTGKFAGVTLHLDYATTTASRELGLGGRASIPQDYGMLFVFPSPGYYGFWMKDTLVPLDMFWLDAWGRVVYLKSDVATSSYPAVFYPTTSALYVLETAAGFAEAHGVVVGTQLLLKKLPTVSQ